MPWYFYWFNFVFFLLIHYCVFASAEFRGSKPVNLRPSLLSNFDYSRFKRDIKLKENTAAQNSSVTSKPDVRLPSETEHESLINTTLSDSVVYNSTHNNVPSWMVPIKSGALQRTGFVVLGFMVIILLFFVVRSVRMHHKKSKSRKYGVITSTDLEMVPLENDEDEEEEMTLFDVKHKFLE